MHRRGHVGIALLAYAPVGFVLLRGGQLGLALLGLVGVLLVEPLPDNDMWIPFLDHRETSHSLLAALVVGGVIGAFGGFIGDRVTVMLASTLAGLDTSTVGIFAGLFQWTAEQLRFLDGRTLAVFGFAVGVFGVFVHLLGDALTIAGIQPLLPLSRWRLSLSSLRADSTLANNVLLGFGVLVLAVVFLVTAPGIGVVGPPGDLAPIGVAAGQSQNASGTGVEFANQSSNGSAVVVESVTLSQPGFVAIHGAGYATGPAPAESSIIAVSERLPAGTHHNVTVDVSHAPPGNPPGLNRSRLNESRTLAAVVYRDTNSNQRFDFVRSFGKTDSAVVSGGTVVSNTARVSVPTSPERTASVTFRNQTLRNNTLVVGRARLPEGGFIVAHNASYRRTGDAVTSAVGVTGYLAPGNYTNLTVSLLPGALNSTQVVTIRPSLDTNNNQRYDYIRSGGFQDVAYETVNRSAVVTDSALVRVPGSERLTQTQTPGSTPAETATSSPTTSESTPTTRSTTRTASQGDVEGSDGLFNGLGIMPAVAIIAVVVGIIAIGRRSG
jgi:membrane-bound metal-dependent hydrolase YbcI (DUF457 family)